MASSISFKWEICPLGNTQICREWQLVAAVSRCIIHNCCQHVAARGHKFIPSLVSICSPLHWLVSINLAHNDLMMLEKPRTQLVDQLADQLYLNYYKAIPNYLIVLQIANKESILKKCRNRKFYLYFRRRWDFSLFEILKIASNRPTIVIVACSAFMQKQRCNQCNLASKIVGQPC